MFELQIVDPKIKEACFQQLYFFLDLPIPSLHESFKFPGCIPVSLRRGNFDSIRRQPYAVTGKLDGIRSLLVLFTFDNEERSFLVDRKMEVYEVSVCADHAFFKGTVLDGEIFMESPRERSLFIFDIYALQGQPCHQYPFRKRLSILNRLLVPSNERSMPLQGEVTPQFFDSCLEEVQEFCLVHQTLALTHPYSRLVLKPFHTGEAMLELLDSIEKKQYLDGLIFMPLREGVTFGTHWTQYKWKWLQTVDLLVEAELHGEFDLRVQAYFRTKRGRHEFHQDIFKDGILLIENVYVKDRSAVVNYDQEDHLVPTLFDPEKMLQRWLSLQYQEGATIPHLKQLVEFAVDLQEKDGRDRMQDKPCIRLVPLKFRYDKIEPNNDWTVQQTIFNVVEHIYLKDVYQAFFNVSQTKEQEKKNISAVQDVLSSLYGEEEKDHEETTLEDPYDPHNWGGDQETSVPVYCLAGDLPDEPSNPQKKDGEIYDPLHAGWEDEQEAYDPYIGQQKLTEFLKE